MQRQQGNAVPDGCMGTVECGEASHINNSGICARCGEWLPTARCRNITCSWACAMGEATLEAAVAHHCSTGHPVRVLIG
jgi:hypothetical protein